MGLWVYGLGFSRPGSYKAPKPDATRQSGDACDHHHRGKQQADFDPAGGRGSLGLPEL